MLPSNSIINNMIGFYHFTLIMLMQEICTAWYSSYSIISYPLQQRAIGSCRLIYNEHCWVGRLWQNYATLPSPLVLLAADAGAGWVALGSTAAKAGRKIAMVYEDPR